MRSIFVGIIVFLLPFMVVAQSQKEVKKKGITKRTVTEIVYEDGLNRELVEELQRFDEEGRLLELKEFSNDGKLKNWVIYTYTTEGEVATESYFSGKEKLKEKVEYIYKDGLRSEKRYYDGKDRLVKKKVYEYEYKQPDK